MKRARVKSVTAALALVLVVLVAALALAAPRPSLANGSAAAQGTPAATQTARSNPANGPAGAFLSIHPQAGFPLDPFLVTVQGGGAVKASTLAPDCAGYVAAGPTVTVDYQGSVDLLRVFFYSDGDPTLVVRTPDGKYLCNDNTNAALLDPTIEVAKPAKGRYDVWIGSAQAKDLIPGFLVFTGHGNVYASNLALEDLVKRPALVEVLTHRERLTNAAARINEALAAVKSVEKLAPGTGSLTAQVTARGELPAPELAAGDALCGGLISVAPNFAFDWSGEAKAIGAMF